MKKLFFLLLCFQGFSQQTINFSLYFETDIYELTEKQKSIINNQFQKLNNKDILRINISGYTDYVDTKNYNATLSENRAKTVANHINKIADTTNIKIQQKAYGEEFSQQINASNGNPDDRRVDLSIVFKNPLKIPKDSLLIGFPVKDIIVGTKIELENLYFFRGRTKMYDYSTGVLDSLGAFMKRNSSFKIEIQGHVCCGGDDPGDVVNIDTKTKTLSVDRANSIFNYLTKTIGIATNRITHKGFGFSQPKAWPEDTVDDERSNRRVEIMITAF